MLQANMILVCWYAKLKKVVIWAQHGIIIMIALYIPSYIIMCMYDDRTLWLVILKRPAAEKNVND